MTELKVDPDRLQLQSISGTGIYIRAELEDRVDRYDIVALDKKSLLAWLRSRGGNNPIAEDMVGHLLGHGHLHDRTASVSAPK